MGIKRILKLFGLLLGWLLFPPIFLLLSYRWKLISPWLRISLFFVAPLTFLVLFIGIVWGKSYLHQEWRGSRSEISMRTGVLFPHLDQAEEDWMYGSRSFNGDFTKVKYYQLDTTDIESFYATLEQMVDSCSSHQDQFHNKTWNKDRNGFSFSVVEGDEFLNLKIDKTSGKMEVIFGEM